MNSREGVAMSAASRRYVVRLGESEHTVQDMPLLRLKGAACAPVAALFDGARQVNVHRQLRALCARCKVQHDCNEKITR